MKILITGATGFIGKRASTALAQAGHEVVGVSRDPERASQDVPALQATYPWDPNREFPPAAAFAGVDAVVHLAGESVVGRWNAEKKQKIYDSRVQGTRHLVGTLSKLAQKPHTLISASAIGYYGDRGDEPLTESASPASGFLADVCKDWEAEALRAQQADLRVACLRIGIVLGTGGGALEAMLRPAKLGAGGPLGSGKQWWSWIHLDDVVGLIGFILDRGLHGPVNATSPHPVRQKDFAKALGGVLHRPSFLPAPAFALKAALGEFSTELLGSKKILPDTALEGGYAFKFPELEAALSDLLVAA